MAPRQPRTKRKGGSSNAEQPSMIRIDDTPDEPTPGTSGLGRGSSRGKTVAGSETLPMRGVEGSQRVYKPRKARTLTRPVHDAPLSEPASAPGSSANSPKSPKRTPAAKRKRTSSQDPSTSSSPSDPAEPPLSDGSDNVGSKSPSARTKAKSKTKGPKMEDPSGDSRDPSTERPGNASAGKNARTPGKGQKATDVLTSQPNFKKNTYLVRGLWEDLFSITMTFSRSDMSSFRDFLKFCEKKKVLEMFRGVVNLSKLLELTEVAIFRCRDMWLENVTLKSQVAWFYLLGLLVVYQPLPLLEYYDRIIRVRLVQSDWSTVEKFLRDVARSGEFGDALVLFNLMYRKQAFLHCFTRATHGLEMNYVQTFLKDREKSQFWQEDVPFAPLLSAMRPHVSEVERLLGRYCELKRSLVDAVDPETADVLSSMLECVKPGFTEEIFAPLTAEVKDAK